MTGTNAAANSSYRDMMNATPSHTTRPHVRRLVTRFFPFSAISIIALFMCFDASAQSRPATLPASRPFARQGLRPTTVPALAADFRVTPSTLSTFTNGHFWHDTDGVHINAHGGGVMFLNGTYYWYGENRTQRVAGARTPSSMGVNCYSSKDLLNWKNEGVVMAVVDDPDSPITRGCIIERPKVLFNAATGKCVMWFHLELRGRGYAAAMAGLAVAERPTGPFTFVRAVRPNAGKWPLDLAEQYRQPLTREESEKMLKADWWPAVRNGAYTRRDFEGGQMSRDMALFVDPDTAKGYLIASAEENYTLNIHELTDDYTNFTGKWTRVVPGGHNEGPAPLKHNGKYYILASGCTGWDPNPARVLQADDIWGPWKNVGNPCTGVNPANGMGPELTFGGQSTAILPVPGKPGAFIAMFDLWRPRQLIESGYIWLPVEFTGDKMRIAWRDRWDLSAFH